MWCGIRAAVVAKVIELSFVGSHHLWSPWLMPCSNGPQHLPLKKSLFHNTALDLPETRGFCERAGAEPQRQGWPPQEWVGRELAASL